MTKSTLSTTAAKKRRRIEIGKKSVSVGSSIIESSSNLLSNKISENGVDRHC